ncbi:hypothetical protein [Carnimonas nigrificans]|uniref:hypothetical protein n=1 Tax=Carnimonas nigrificans TaxID=64323 RepID=UPI00046FA2F7|nr:hypothetical protein [Carnimonas nigrificans]
MVLKSFASRGLYAAPAFALLLSGCSFFGGGEYTDRNYEYYHADMTSPLELPATRDNTQYQDLMPVPNAAQAFVAPEGKFKVPRPNTPGGEQPAAGGTVRDQEANGQRWLIVPGTPSQVWPRLVDFAQNSSNIQALTPAQGQIEADDFTIAVRQGQRPGTTEVYCLTRNTTNQQCVTDLQSTLSSSSNQ